MKVYKFLLLISICCAISLTAQALVQNDQTRSNELVVKIPGFTSQEIRTLLVPHIVKIGGILSVDNIGRKELRFISYNPALISTGGILQLIKQIGFEVDQSSGPKPGAKDFTNIELFEIALVCPALPSIGCGSEAYPLLCELEKEKSVRSAWLNHTGTILLIDWMPGLKPDAVIEPLRQYSQSKDSGFKLLLKNRRTAALNEFVNQDNWLRAYNVHKLSKIEATAVGRRLVGNLRGTNNELNAHKQWPRKKLENLIYYYFLGDLSRDEFYQSCFTALSNASVPLRSRDLFFEALSAAFWSE